MSGHLTSEQMETMLAARASTEVTRHVERCATCAEEVASLRVMFGGLRETATTVAARQRELARVPARATGFRVPRFAWGLAAAALFVGVSAPIAIHLRPTVTTPVTQGTPSTGAAMSDEALLNSVQDDLSSSVPESLRPLASASSGTDTNTTNVRTN